MNEKQLFLLDAYALIYRSYYAFMRTPMYNSKGMNTSTIFGFLLSLDDIIKNKRPTHIAAVFDLDKPTFRHQIYPDYKANRQITPEEIKKSVPVIKKILSIMNIEILEYPGYEADDIIGTIAKKAANKEYKVFMVTPDKDFCQLVDKNIFIYKPKKSGNESEIIGIEEVNKKFNIKNPEQFIEILAIWGDSSDNVPGVPGIGEKTASKLIAEYSSIDNIFSNLDKLSPRQKELFQQNKEILSLSKQLVTINTSVPIEFIEEKLEIKNYNENESELKELFNELNFKSLITKFIRTTDIDPVNKSNYTQGNLFEQKQSERENYYNTGFYETIKTIKHSYNILNTENEIIELCNKLETLSEFCFDTETTGLDPHKDFIIGISISFEKNIAYYIPISIDMEKARKRIQLFKNVFENSSISKIGHNLKFDILFLNRYDIKVDGNYFDTMIAHYLVHPELNHKMDNIAEKYLNYSPVPIEQLIGKKGQLQLNMKNITLEIISEYACEDADVTFQLKEILVNELQNNNLNYLFYNIEAKLLNVLIEIETNGFKIDSKYLELYGNQLKKEILNVEKEIYNLANQEFNINSPKQLGEILFEKLKISEGAKLTKTKQYSTSEEILQKLTDKHLIIYKILDYRSLTKLLSTYVEALPKLLNSKTGKIHTNFNQTLTVTGRLSSNNPNLQNIPIREARGREIRNAFIPSSEEYILLSADYSQIELRIMAHMCKDTNMIEAFINNVDIHTSTAAKIFKVSVENVSKEQRGKAKTANFGIIYGISAFGLAERMKIPRREAGLLIDEYFNTFPGVKHYMTGTILFAKEKGYVETIMNRRRNIPDINSKNATVRGMAERNAINTPIQGSAADIIKIAMITIHEEFKEKNLKSKMILQVHDELVFDVFKPELEEVKKIVKSKMENAVKLLVPLTVEIGIGKTWLEAH